MKHLTNLLVIGGTGRNIGKTTLAVKIIERFSKETQLITLKTSVLLPGEAYLHGHHKMMKSDAFELMEEKSPEGEKDSQRYVRAGAAKSYFLSVGEKAVPEALRFFWNKITPLTPVVAESNLLNDYYIPGVFIMIKGNRAVKPQAKVLLQKADVVIPEMDVDYFNRIVKNLCFKDGRWNLI